MSEILALHSSAVLADRPFTDPLHTAHDLRIIHHILHHVRGAVTHLPLNHAAYVGGDARWRFVFNGVARLRQPVDRLLVAFFGIKRVDADVLAVGEADEQLIAELTQHEGVLCYATHCIERGDSTGEYANLVLFDSEAAKMRWASGQYHARAARELSPLYYRHIRLHSGLLPGGLLAEHAPLLTHTKYYDFEMGSTEQDRGGPWRAVRDYGVEN